MKRETVGKISSELLQKESESRDPIELQREMQKDYLKELFRCIEDNYRNYTDTFYVVVITKNERLMPNVFRNYFFARQTCPTPDYDQTVWKIDIQEKSVDYLWTIPSRDASHYLKNNTSLVHPEEQELLGNVLKFADGTLYKLCKKLNGESPISNELIT
ncbi:MAG TPA: hypothetical protein VFF04_04605 [Candidatus Babeliales bacterium]|nr:hypothetical protein [Candidatus Babeliales bacterium]